MNTFPVSDTSFFQSLLKSFTVFQTSVQSISTSLLLNSSTLESNCSLLYVCYLHTAGRLGVCMVALEAVGLPLILHCVTQWMVKNGLPANFIANIPTDPLAAVDTGIYSTLLQRVLLQLGCVVWGREVWSLYTCRIFWWGVDSTVYLMHSKGSRSASDQGSFRFRWLFLESQSLLFLPKDICTALWVVGAT